MAFFVYYGIPNYRDSISAIIITWGGIPISCRVKVELSHGCFINEYFCRVMELVCEVDKAEPFNYCDASKLSSKCF